MADAVVDKFALEMRAVKEELAALRHLIEQHLPGIHRELVMARETREAMADDAQRAL